MSTRPAQPNPSPTTYTAAAGSLLFWIVSLAIVTLSSCPGSESFSVPTPTSALSTTTPSVKLFLRPPWREDDKAEDYFCDERWKLPEEEHLLATQLLKEHDIESALQLREKYLDFGGSFSAAIETIFADALKRSSYFTPNCISGFSTGLISLEEALTPEFVLNNNKFINEHGTRLAKSRTEEATFSEGAVSVRDRTKTQSTRGGYDIRIVLGPSGSGKTVFALNQLGVFQEEREDAAEGQGQGQDRARVCIYYSLAHYFEEDPIKFQEHISVMLQKALLEGSNQKWDGESKLPMKVSLILDEAGAIPDLLGNYTVLTSVHDMMKNKADSVRLIVAGTGYDSAASGLSSSRDVYKYQMRPWDEARLRAAAIGKNIDLKIVDAIVDSRMLRTLISNARTAVHTLDAVRDVKKGRSHHNIDGNVGTIIDYVIARYISQNGIGNLDEIDQTKLVYAVFHELHESNLSSKPSMPKFATLSAKGENHVKRQALSVMSINVEKHGSDLVFADRDEKSVSITPAISLLLYTLLQVNSIVFANWAGFEDITALHAVYLEVLNNKDTKEKGVQLARLTSAVPALRASRRVRVPPVGNKPTVFINGPMAPFCDVISRDKGFQSKYSQNGDSVSFNLGEELQKCGLLSQQLRVRLEDFMKESDQEDAKKLKEAQEEKAKKERRYEKAHRMGQATLDAMMLSWSETSEMKPTSSPQSKLDRMPSKGCAYLSPSFIFPEVGSTKAQMVSPSLEYEIGDGGSLLRKGKELQPPDLDFTMVFVTNAREMRLTPKHKNSEVVITSDAVDANGKIKEEKKPLDYESWLDLLNIRAGVKLRYFFRPDSDWSSN